MKVLNHPLVSAVALSMFCSLSMIAALISPEHIWVYHHVGSPTPIFGGVMIFYVTAWVFFSGLLLLAERFRAGRLIVWTGILTLLPYTLVEQAQNMELIKPPALYKRILFLICLGLWLTCIWMWRQLPQQFERFRGLMSSVLGFAAMGSVVTLLQLVWCYGQAFGIERPVVLHQRTHDVAYLGSPHQRVIWIVLDELSYDQVYSNRYPGLNLPNFDALAKESTVFGQVKPAANETRVAIPAMLTGRSLTGIRAASNGSNVVLVPSDGKRSIPFDPHDSIFGDAIAMGDATGVSGWFNPYCRVLGPVLDRCFATMEDEFQEGMETRGSVLGNSVAPWTGLLSKLAAPFHGYQRDMNIIDKERAERIEDYNELVASGDSLLVDRSIDLKFLHMPFPHPPGYYDRKTGRFTTGASTYIDNLQLSDIYLQHVRELLTTHGEWDSDAILITGDHSWRTTLLWMGGVDWSPEEQRASNGAFDDRPAWILKLPNQHEGARVDTPVNAVIARSLVRDLLNSKVKTTSDIAALTQGSLLPTENRAEDRNRTGRRPPKQVAITPQRHLSAE